MRMLMLYQINQIIVNVNNNNTMEIISKHFFAYLLQAYQVPHGRSHDFRNLNMN